MRYSNDDNIINTATTFPLFYMLFYIFICTFNSVRVEEAPFKNTRSHRTRFGVHCRHRPQPDLSFSSLTHGRDHVSRDFHDRSISDLAYLRLSQLSRDPQEITRSQESRHGPDIDRFRSRIRSRGYGFQDCDLHDPRTILAICRPQSMGEHRNVLP